MSAGAVPPLSVQRSSPTDWLLPECWTVVRKEKAVAKKKDVLLRLDTGKTRKEVHGAGQNAVSAVSRAHPQAHFSRTDNQCRSSRAIDPMNE